MSDSIFKYPLDLTGTSPDNRVENEVHVIGNTTGRIFIADYGPFFGSSAVVIDANTGHVLTPMTDYLLVHYYAEASERAGAGVYAGVRVINSSVGTNLLFSCQYVGGEYSYSYYALIQSIQALEEDDRSVTWGQLVGVPSEFNPTSHLHSAYDLYGLKSMVESQYDVAKAIRDGDTVSRELLLSQIRAKFDVWDDVYIKRTQVQQMIDDILGGEEGQNLEALALRLDNHINTINAHNVTLQVLGIPKVRNYGYATPAEAIEGTRDDLVIVATALKAAMDARVDPQARCKQYFFSQS